MSKESVPADYVVPKVWEMKDTGGRWAATNRPTAGARSQKDLEVGEHPIQLYSVGTPNGQKVTMMLEELGIEYDAWLINIFGEEHPQFSSGFVAINPNSKIPAMVDHSVSPPLRVFESGSILLYLAEKYNKFIPTDPAGRTECLNWLFWQVGTGPFVGGGFGHFYNYAPQNFEYAIDRFSMEVKRQLDVLDKHLAGKAFMCGSEITIADFAIFPWVRIIRHGYNAAEFLQLDSYTNVVEWCKRIEARPACARGLLVNTSGKPGSLAERHSAADFNK